MLSSYSVHLTDSDFPDTALEEAVLSPAGITLQRHHCRVPDEIVAACQEADALLVQWAPITRGVLEELPRLKAIARFGIGMDMIDVAAASELGIAVCNTPNYCIDEVATHALSMILTFARGLQPFQAAVRQHRWGYEAVDTSIHLLSEQTLGLVGVGRIGRRLAQLSRCLGMQPVAYDPYAQGVDIPLVAFNELLTRSDFISIHCPLTQETRNLFDEKALSAMKPSAYLINVARGPIVNTEALNRALRTGQIAGAGLDVLPNEPPVWDDPLLSAPNLIVTPHVAWYSDGAPERMRREAAMALVKLFQGEKPSGLLNPDVL